MLNLNMTTMSLFLSLLIISVSLELNTKADPTLVGHDCCACETTNSAYKSNLNHLLSTLSSKATALQFHYDTATSGQDSPHGLFLCRGDVSPDVCRGCVDYGAKDIVKQCPDEKEAVIWYDECLLRYSNQSFFGTMDIFPKSTLSNSEKVINQSGFDELLGVTMKMALEEASAKNGTEKKFATRVDNFTNFHTLYSLVQCTPDLSSADCKKCLNTAIGYFASCCDGYVGGRVLLPSCNVRYERYPFFNQTPTPPPLQHSKGHKISSLITGAIVGVIAVCIALFILCFCLFRRRGKKNWHNLRQQEKDENSDKITDVESLQFDFARIEVATKSFSSDCLLGKGGFGEVYKGILPNGQEIAVKRLSKSSRQGLEEFKNEVKSLAKLQHRNLVRLLGFCFEGEEKLLVYEFVLNKSLDYFLFDSEKRGQLDWAGRYNIIRGIARGILYLHEDSTLQIIHRDLKASNILLDAKMNPKISDFGTARIFTADQTRANTSKIIGTRSYMSPEYAKHGHFSVKSDVYSFGILVLEIISGQKHSLYQSNGAPDLLSYAWKVWEDKTPKEFFDPTILDSYSESEVSKCIHMGLLCVQENPEVRPTMGAIVHMLSTRDLVTMQVPQRQGIYSI